MHMVSSKELEMNFRCLAMAHTWQHQVFSILSIRCPHGVWNRLAHVSFIDVCSWEDVSIIDMITLNTAVAVSKIAC